MRGRSPDKPKAAKLALLAFCICIFFSAFDTNSISAGEQVIEQTRTAVQTTEQTEATVEPAVLSEGAELPANERAGQASVLPVSGIATEKVGTLQIAPVSAFGYEVFGSALVYNGAELEIGALPETVLENNTGEPAVLIYHTHSCEAYTPDELDSYSVGSDGRCENPAYSVVRVGDELAAELARYGIRAIHDRTLYDCPTYTGAYGRSAEGVRSLLEENPSVCLVLDIHRDAVTDADGVKYRLAASSGGETCAQLMLIAGTSASGEEHPNWRENLSAAVKLQQSLISLSPGSARPVKLTRAAYNQFIHPGALIVEVGAQGNSLREALLSARLLAAAINEVLK